MDSNELVPLSSAVQDFRNARRRASMERILSRLRGKSSDLLSYEEVRQQLHALERSAEKLEDIPLDAIIGSVGRYADFTRSFLPTKESDVERWARVKVGATGLSGLPPIEVYRVGETYFVKDGHHRISVAREEGAKHIQAYVTEVRTEVPLTPEVQPRDLILKAEYADFLERTRLHDFRPDANLELSEIGGYYKLQQHIDVHRHYMGVEGYREVPLDEAVTSWHDTVYMPLILPIRETGIMHDFPRRTESDLYLWLAEYRSALHEELGWEVQADSVATDLASQASPRLSRFASRWSARILDAVIPDELESGPSPGEWRKVKEQRGSIETLFSDILVAVRGDEESWSAVEQAILIAQKEGGRVHGLQIVSTELLKEIGEADGVYEEFLKRCESGGIQGTFRKEAGDVPRRICERLRWADLLAIRLSHPPGTRPTSRLGSGFRTIIRRCPRPTLVVPWKAQPLERALIAFDGSPKATEGLYVGTYMARHWGTQLDMLAVGDKRKNDGSVLDKAQTYVDSHGVEATFIYKDGNPGEEVLNTLVERKNDLLIMGGYGTNPVREVIVGSTVDYLLRESTIPMFICR